MVVKSCQFLEYIFCYDATNLVKFYVPTWTLSLAWPHSYVGMYSIHVCVYTQVNQSTVLAGIIPGLLNYVWHISSQPYTPTEGYRSASIQIMIMQLRKAVIKGSICNIAFTYVTVQAKTSLVHTYKIDTQRIITSLGTQLASSYLWGLQI